MPVAITKTANVAFVHPKLAQLLPEYELIRDCLDGEVAIKKAKSKYLPIPNAADKSPENVARYDAYLARAVFYNVARQTLKGLVGQVFEKEPETEIDGQLDALVNNADGMGVTLEQQAQKTLRLALSYSRCGVLVDYPDTGGQGVSRADIQSGLVRPTLHVYGPTEVINWRTLEMGAEEILSLVVLVEQIPILDDGFEIKTAAQFRVLRLVNGVYHQEIWKEENPTEWKDVKKMPRGNFNSVKVSIPQDSAGKPFDRLPFWFVGSENNDSIPDSPVFYDICSLNVAHYRNSADYEESCFIVGQPTPVVTGLSEHWYKEIMKERIAFGSRGGIPLPQNGTAALLQAQESTMIFEAMKAKERQMVAIGARLFDTGEIERTATEVGLETAGENSILSGVAKNVSKAFEAALEFAYKFAGLTGKPTYKLNTDFEVSKLTPEARGEIIKEWQAGALSFVEMRTQLKRAGVATEDDNTVKAEHEKAKEAEHQKQIELKAKPPITA